MTSFALLTEGATDQAVIENVLFGFLGNEISVNPLQPLYDETDASRIEYTGGWQNLFKYCGTSKFAEALQFNDFVIVQVDTDRSEDPGFDVVRQLAGSIKFEIEEFVSRVEERLIEQIGEDLFRLCSSRVIFAVCVHSLECWLLPLYEDDDKRAGSVENCLHKLNRALAKKNIKALSRKKPRDYDAISRGFLKRPTLTKCAARNPTLKMFLSRLGDFLNGPPVD